MMISISVLDVAVILVGLSISRVALTSVEKDNRALPSLLWFSGSTSQLRLCRFGRLLKHSDSPTQVLFLKFVNTNVI